MYGVRRSRSLDVDLSLSQEETSMHPLLMTQFAEAHSVALREDADARRRSLRARAKRSFSLPVPRRRARVAHA
jgi:hypothetical protein